LVDLFEYMMMHGLATPNLFSPICSLLPDWQTHDTVWQWNSLPPSLLHTS